MFNYCPFILNKMTKVSIIGSGFSSLSAACYLAKAGFEVDIYEKNDQIGGRARVFKKEGFRFDMGPSWYWMPDVFERFFSDFGKQPSDYYELIRLSPAYTVYFEGFSSIKIPGNAKDIYEVFEGEERGSSRALEKFLKTAKYNYEVAIGDLVYKPGLSPMELITPKTISKVNQFFSSISHEIRKLFKSEKLIRILEFPVLFLGAKPQDTPAFYSFMNYADFVLGTWYPKGGMCRVVEALQSLAIALGVRIHTNSPVDKIMTDQNRTVGVIVNDEEVFSDVVLSGADYYHTETLLGPQLRSYSEKYWEKRVFAPSALVFYVGFDKKLDGLSHHLLFFDEDFDSHVREIYDEPKWPKSPLFYANFTSVTDQSVAPEGKECGFFLIPLAPDLEDTEEVREEYFDKIMERLEAHTRQSIKKHIRFKTSYAVDDFKRDYHSYKGNAYGMANTLRQTAFLRPRIKSKKVGGLYFTGQLTVPGPGVPPALISGKVVAQQVIRENAKNQKHEVNI